MPPTLPRRCCCRRQRCPPSSSSSVERDGDGVGHRLDACLCHCCIEVGPEVSHVHIRILLLQGRGEQGVVRCVSDGRAWRRVGQLQAPRPAVPPSSSSSDSGGASRKNSSSRAARTRTRTHLVDPWVARPAVHRVGPVGVGVQHILHPAQGGGGKAARSVNVSRSFTQRLPPEYSQPPKSTLAADRSSCRLQSRHRKQAQTQRAAGLPLCPSHDRDFQQGSGARQATQQREFGTIACSNERSLDSAVEVDAPKEGVVPALAHPLAVPALRRQHDLAVVVAARGWRGTGNRE